MADAAAAPAPAPAQAPSSSSAIRTAATTADRWPALESNAEVMTDFLQRLTTTSSSSASTTTPTAPFTFADVFSLDEDCLAFVPQPVHALLLAYASDAIKDKASSDGAAAGAGSSKPVFIRQLPALDAACGTVALLHAAANAPELRAATPADSLLGRFLAGSGDAATPEAWGERLDGDDALRAAHWCVECVCVAHRPSLLLFDRLISHTHFSTVPHTRPQRLRERRRDRGGARGRRGLPLRLLPANR